MARPAGRRCAMSRGIHDAGLGLLIETLAREISGRTQPSALLLESVAQAAAIHVVRGYVDPGRTNIRRRSAIPAYPPAAGDGADAADPGEGIRSRPLCAHCRDERGAFQPAVQAFHRACPLAILHRACGSPPRAGSCARPIGRSSRSGWMSAIPARAISAQVFRRKRASRPGLIAAISPGLVTPF